MTSAITVLLIVSLIVFLSMITPSGSYLDPPPVDRDQERLRNDLRLRC